MVPVVSHQACEFDIGAHVFPTAKYRLVRERLLAEGTITSTDVVEPEPVTDEDVRLVHTRQYVRKIVEGTLSLQEQMQLEIPFRPEMRDAMWLMTATAARANRVIGVRPLYPYPPWPGISSTSSADGMGPCMRVTRAIRRRAFCCTTTAAARNTRAGAGPCGSCTQRPVPRFPTRFGASTNSSNYRERRNRSSFVGPFGF